MDSAPTTLWWHVFALPSLHDDTDIEEGDSDTGTDEGDEVTDETDDTTSDSNETSGEESGEDDDE